MIYRATPPRYGVLAPMTHGHRHMWTGWFGRLSVTVWVVAGSGVSRRTRRLGMYAGQFKEAWVNGFSTAQADDR